MRLGDPLVLFLVTPVVAELDVTHGHDEIGLGGPDRGFVLLDPGFGRGMEPESRSFILDLVQGQMSQGGVFADLHCMIFRARPQALFHFLVLGP